MRSRGVGSQAQQAIMLSRAFLVNAMSGVAATLWYDWRDEKDDNSSKTHAFGLIHCLANDTDPALFPPATCSATDPELDKLASIPWGHPSAYTNAPALSCFATDGFAMTCHV